MPLQTEFKRSPLNAANSTLGSSDLIGQNLSKSINTLDMLSGGNRNLPHYHSLATVACDFAPPHQLTTTTTTATNSASGSGTRLFSLLTRPQPNFITTTTSGGDKITNASFSHNDLSTIGGLTAQGFYNSSSTTASPTIQVVTASSIDQQARNSVLTKLVKNKNKVSNC